MILPSAPGAGGLKALVFIPRLQGKAGVQKSRFQ
jgi:hypothetical protein